MTIQEFLENLYSELEIESVEKIGLETNLKELDEWDSMTSMILIGFISDNFSINIDGDDIENMTTIESLLNDKNINL